MADAVVSLPPGSSRRDTARARAIVLWTAFVVPVSLVMSGVRPNNTEFSLQVLGSLICAAGVVATVAYLRFSKKTIAAGWGFGVSTMLGLALEPLISGNTSSLNLILLASTPVIFGYMVNWRACFQACGVLLLYYPAVYGVSVVLGRPDPNSILFLFACAVTMIGCGLSTVAFSWATSKSAALLRSQKHAIEKIARTDVLTKALNRRAFNEALQSLPEIDDKRCVTLVLFDLDGFKTINDQFGHDAGDSILTAVSERVRNDLPANAKLFRLGGDEFAVICQGDDDVQIDKEIAALVETALASTIPTREGEVSISASIGSDQMRGAVQNPISLYRNADVALFQAKQNSRQSWQAYTAELGDRVERRRALLDRLKVAIAEEQLTIVYQPQHNVSSGRVVGFEALTRWHDARFGQVPPDEFITLAEESGLVADLDKTMIRQAINSAEDWMAPDVSLAVNVSGATLVSDRFVDFIDEVISQSSLRPHQIQLEITETALIEKWETAQETVLALSKLGVSLALDDFGTGYSSLSYLSSFPIDRLKIDRSFLQDKNLATNVKVMQSIMTLAGSLELDVLIEGVETKRHLKIVDELGCSKVQGYLFSAPLLPTETVEYLEAYNFPPIRKTA